MRDIFMYVESNGSAAGSHASNCSGGAATTLTKAGGPSPDHEALQALGMGSGEDRIGWRKKVLWEKLRKETG